MFGPKRTLKSLMRELETGLREGTIVLDSTAAAQRKDLSDDGKQSDQQGPEIIVIPPAPPATSASPSPGSAPQERPQT